MVTNTERIQDYPQVFLRLGLLSECTVGINTISILIPILHLTVNMAFSYFIRNHDYIGMDINRIYLFYWYIDPCIPLQCHSIPFYLIRDIDGIIYNNRYSSSTSGNGCTEESIKINNCCDDDDNAGVLLYVYFCNNVKGIILSRDPTQIRSMR